MRHYPLALIACCCLCPFAWADFAGVVVSRNTDADTTNLCTNANGPFVPVPLTVCSVSIAFDEVGDRLLSAAFSDVQVFDGSTPDVFYQHVFSSANRAPSCAPVAAFPDLICDSFVTIGLTCGDDADWTNVDGEFISDDFRFEGHVSGGWFNAVPFSTQGEAFSPVNPDGQVLVAQFSVAQGLTVSGNMTVFVQGDSPTRPLPPECGDCPADHSSGNGVVTALDLAQLLGGWGPVEPFSACCDANEDGAIDAYDLGALLNNWGPCEGVRAVESFEVSFACEFPCPGDLDNSGAVGALDLSQLLASWGDCRDCIADLNEDGNVGPLDLASLLGAWGSCP